MNKDLLKYFPKKNKYGAKKQKCSLGHSHRSEGESMYCWQLQIKKKQGLIMDFVYEKKYELRVLGTLVGCHKPDFTVINTDGSIEIREYKGFETEAWQLRRKMFEAIYPSIPYRVIK